MNEKPKKKLCWNCEGSVSLENENCPYCGVYLSSIAMSGQGDKDTLFAPPYRLANSHADKEVPPSPFANSGTSEVASVSTQLDNTEIASRDSMKKIIMTLVLLLGGSGFLLFGLVLLLFSDQGVFTLHWNGSYWPLYFVFAAPMLFVGWRTLQQLHEDVTA